MRKAMGLAAAVCCFAVLGAVRGGDAKKEAEKLQGTWKVIRFELGGSERPPQKEVAVSQGDKLTFKPIWDVWTYKLDPSSLPKAIDLIPASGADKGRVWPGIYEFDGERLKICYIPQVDAKRPPRLETKRGELQRLFLLERVK